jgi:DNA replication protein DnaC
VSPRPQPFVPKLNQAEEGTLKGQLIKLGMYTIAASFEVEAERAANNETPYAAYLARLIELEMTDKADRSVNARVARARFPVMRTLEEFDFTFQPGLSVVRVPELANLAFLDHATNVLFIGGPGVGKTHLAISRGLKACGARRSVLFNSAADLLDELVAAEVSHNLGKVLAHLRRVDLLIVDELGNLPMDGRRANLFFQLVAPRPT